jgi:hypothetical protein
MARRRTLLRTWRRVVAYGPALVVIVAGGWQATTWWLERSDRARDDANNRQERARGDEANRQQAMKIALRESQKTFLERQLQLYFEVSRVTAKLATLPARLPDTGPADNETYEWANRRFWELYWGELSVVESPEVARAMVDFGEQLRKVTDCRAANEGDCRSQQEQLSGLSYKLAGRLRESIQAGWDYALPRTDPKK